MSSVAKGSPISATAELLYISRQSVRILYNGPPLRPSNCPFQWGSKPLSNTWYLGPMRVPKPNGISIGSTVFAGLTTVTDRQTDRPRYSVGNSRRIYACSTAMRPNKQNRTGHLLALDIRSIVKGPVKLSWLSNAVPKYGVTSLHAMRSVCLLNNGERN